MKIKKVVVRGVEYWEADVTIAGRRLRPRAKTRKQVEAQVSELRLTARAAAMGLTPRAPAPAPVTVRELVEARIDRIRLPKTAVGYFSHLSAEKVLSRFLSKLPQGLRVTDLTPAHLAAYRDARLKAGLKPQTVWRELTDLQACLNSAHELFASLEMWTPPRRPKVKVPRAGRQAVITPTQAHKLLGELRRGRETGEQESEYEARLFAADLFQVLLMTAARKGEVMRMRWGDINWHWKTIRVDSTKTGEEGVIAATDALLALLARRRSEQNPPSEYVFPSRRNPNQPLTRFHYPVMWRAARRCGVTWGYGSPNGIVLHTTRHSAVSAMLEAGASVPAAQSMSRHSDREMFARYAHVSRGAQVDAARALDKFAPPAEGGEKVVGILSGVVEQGGTEGARSRRKRRKKAG